MSLTNTTYVDIYAMLVLKNMILNVVYYVGQ